MSYVSRWVKVLPTGALPLTLTGAIGINGKPRRSLQGPVSKLSRVHHCVMDRVLMAMVMHGAEMALGVWWLLDTTAFSEKRAYRCLLDVAPH